MTRHLFLGVFFSIFTAASSNVCAQSADDLRAPDLLNKRRIYQFEDMTYLGTVHVDGSYNTVRKQISVSPAATFEKIAFFTYGRMTVQPFKVIYSDGSTQFIGWNDMVWSNEVRNVPCSPKGMVEACYPLIQFAKVDSSKPIASIIVNEVSWYKAKTAAGVFYGVKGSEIYENDLSVLKFKKYGPTEQLVTIPAFNLADDFSRLILLSDGALSINEVRVRYQDGSTESLISNTSVDSTHSLALSVPKKPGRLAEIIVQAIAYRNVKLAIRGYSLPRPLIPVTLKASVDKKVATIGWVSPMESPAVKFLVAFASGLKYPDCKKGKKVKGFSIRAKVQNFKAYSVSVCSMNRFGDISEPAQLQFSTP